MHFALTVISGSPGNTTDPSGTAHISASSLKFLIKSMNLSEKIFFDLKYFTSSSVNERFFKYDIQDSRPQQIANPPLSGIFLKNRSK